MTGGTGSELSRPLSARRRACQWSSESPGPESESGSGAMPGPARQKPGPIACHRLRVPSATERSAPFDPGTGHPSPTRPGPSESVAGVVMERAAAGERARARRRRRRRRRRRAGACWRDGPSHVIHHESGSSSAPAVTRRTPSRRGTRRLSNRPGPGRPVPSHAERRVGASAGAGGYAAAPAATAHARAACASRGPRRADAMRISGRRARPRRPAVLPE